MEMSVTPRLSWKTQASQALSRLKNGGHPPRIAVVGIGSELRGDDAAGLALARELGAHLPAGFDERLLLIEGGSAPENASGALRRFRPDLVLMLDAAQLGAEPGAVRWLAASQADGFSASTHSLPLHMLAAYLEAELGCAVALLGIQPAALSFDAPLSPPVKDAVGEVARVLSALLSEM
jgi:hydrogenase 3 maturation protease